MGAMHSLAAAAIAFGVVLLGVSPAFAVLAAVSAVHG